MQTQIQHNIKKPDFERFKQQSVLPASTKKLKQTLLALTSAAMLSLALNSPAMAQNNDVDAYDGTEDTGCDAMMPVGSTETLSLSLIHI